MKILIYGINYSPELTGIGKYTGDMSEWLVQQGHEVHAVTAPPYYPAWKVRKGYSAWQYRHEIMAGVKVWRCPLWVPHQLSGLKRIFHLASFAFSSLPITLWQALFWHPDIVFVVEPPFFCLPGALLAARLGRAKAWLHIQDFEIDAGFELGLVSSSEGVRNLITRIERWLMNQCDCISTISEFMLKRLVSKGVEPSRCLLFSNWVDTDAIRPIHEPNFLRTELGIAADTIVVLYSGSLGGKQGLETLIVTAGLLEAHTHLCFVICGMGDSKKRLLALAKGSPNIRFLNLQPIEKLNALLNLANIHLLPQCADAADLVMPSKLQGMFASGRSVIATAHPSTQIAKVVEGHGIVVPPGDVKALAEAILYLAAHPEKVARLGQAAREFAVIHWHREKILAQFEQAFLRLQSKVKDLSRNAF